MPSIRVHKPNNALFFDFRFEDERCREYTLLNDTPSNRKTLQKVLDKIESEINAGSFVYENYFPNSKALERIAKARADRVAKTSAVAIAVEGSAQAAGTVAAPVALGPTFKDFANQWVDEHSIEWRRSHIKSLLSTLNGRLIPEFGSRVVGSISKADVLAYRASLAKVQGRGDKIGLSPKRINEIMGLLRQILNEAADRFEFTSPLTNIKKLRQPRADVDPLSLVDVQRIIATVRPDYKDYFITRFFTGMRTGEVHGLKWKYVDFDLRVIRVRETFILGEDDYTKTDGSQRDIQMSQPVYDAMKRQLEVTGKLSDYVFCNLMGQPLDNKNFTDRVWYPLLRHLNLKQRRPYQMRHTAATLWLAAGEAPEWIANQLGHASTQMLFRVYSRYVPNLTRQDGSAMERLLASRMSQGPLVESETASGQKVHVHIDQIVPLPVPKARGVQAHSVLKTGKPIPKPKAHDTATASTHAPAPTTAQPQVPKPTRPSTGFANYTLPVMASYTFKGIHTSKASERDDDNAQPQPPPVYWRLSAKASHSTGLHLN
jgi:integrase